MARVQVSLDGPADRVGMSVVLLVVAIGVVVVVLVELSVIVDDKVVVVDVVDDSVVVSVDDDAVLVSDDVDGVVGVVVVVPNLTGITRRRRPGAGLAAAAAHRAGTETK